MEQQEANTTGTLMAQPLIGSLLPINSLTSEYSSNESFLKGITNLSQRYTGVRRVLGDGNCFYRAFLYSYLEGLLNDSEELARVLAKINLSKQELVQLGYSEIAIESFWEAFVEELQSLSTKSHTELELEFSKSDGESDYLVWYCRLLASGYLKSNAERFLPFINGLCSGMSVEEFCSSEVEPMNKECEQVQVIALAEYLQVGIKIEYLDRSSILEGDLQHYNCPDGVPTRVFLLYRPGHYDILYV